MTRWNLKQKVQVLLGTILWIVAICLILSIIPVSKADTTEDGIEIIDLIPVAEEVEQPIQTIEFQHSEEDINDLCEALWKSPLRHEEAKKKLIWVILNRVSDTSGLFENDIDSVIRQRGEFSFMKSHRWHVSEENRKLVIQELDRWESVNRGLNIGDYPKGAVYCSFYGNHNQNIRLYDSEWNEVA